MNSIYNLSIFFLLVISILQNISSQEETKKQNTDIKMIRKIKNTEVTGIIIYLLGKKYNLTKTAQHR
jgi:hypothetical protein